MIIEVYFLVFSLIRFGITKGFKAKRCGSFSEMKENRCKDVVQRKKHAVEILEVKEILSLKKICIKHAY